MCLENLIVKCVGFFKVFHCANFGVFAVSFGEIEADSIAKIQH